MGHSAGVGMKHSISSTSRITDISTYMQLSLHPKTVMAYRGIEVTCLTCVTFQGGLRHDVDPQTCTKILTEHAAGMDSMIHENAGTCLPGFMVSHRTRLYLALTTTVFTTVKYQRFTCDDIVAMFTVFKIDVVVQYSYSIVQD
jgi:hypothetical protein